MRKLATLLLLTLACEPRTTVETPVPTKEPKTQQELIVAMSEEIRRFGFSVDLAKLLMENREPAGMREVADNYVTITRKTTSFEAIAALRRALEIPPLTNGKGLREGVVQMLANSMLVGFIHDRDIVVFNTATYQPGGPLEHALARALMFAYIDQRLGGLAASVFDSQSTSDVALVRQCLAEGFATYVADTIHASRRGKDTATPTDVAAALLGTNANVPCAPGTAYVARVHATGGWQAVVAAFGASPTSTEQLLHANKLEKDFPVHIELPFWPQHAGEAEPIHDDVMGELAIERILRERGYDDETASKAAAGWDGDRLGLWRVPSGDGVLVWRSVWDREEDAEQFAAAIAPFEKNDGHGFRIVRRGRMVDAVSAESEDLAVKWYTTLQDSLDNLAIEPSDAASTREVESEAPPRPR